MNRLGRGIDELASLCSHCFLTSSAAVEPCWDDAFSLANRTSSKSAEASHAELDGGESGGVVTVRGGSSPLSRRASSLRCWARADGVSVEESAEDELKASDKRRKKDFDLDEDGVRGDDCPSAFPDELES